MAAALGVTMIVTASLTPTLRLTLLCLAGLAAAAVRCSFGAAQGWAVFAATALLSLLLAPEKAPALLYLLFGWYPTVKLRIEKTENAASRWAVKLTIFAIISAVIAWTAGKLAPDALTVPRWMLWPGTMALCLVYDVAVKEALLLYLRKIAGRIGNG